MPVVSQTRVKLTPELIIEAALAVAERAEPTGITGKSLGDHLGVDRSAVWRHFPNQDALLLAVGDRLLQLAVERVDRSLPPMDRLRTLAREVVRVFAQHPYVGAAVDCRVMAGPGEIAVVELMLTVLRELGLPRQKVALYQRMLSETLLAWAGTEAGYAVLPEETRAVDARKWLGTYGLLGAEEFPAISVYARELAGLDRGEVFEALLGALLLSVQVDATMSQEQMES